MPLAGQEVQTLLLSAHQLASVISLPANSFLARSQALLDITIFLKKTTTIHMDSVPYYIGWKGVADICNPENNGTSLNPPSCSILKIRTDIYSKNGGIRRALNFICFQVLYWIMYQLPCWELHSYFAQWSSCFI